MSEESEREEIKDETHHIQDEEQEEFDEVEEEDRGAEWEEDCSNNRTNISLISPQRNTSFMIACIFYHPFINPIVNPADILPVNGIPKLVIANEEEADAAAAAIRASSLPSSLANNNRQELTHKNDVYETEWQI